MAILKSMRAKTNWTKCPGACWNWLHKSVKLGSLCDAPLFFAELAWHFWNFVVCNTQAHLTRNHIPVFGAACKTKVAQWAKGNVLDACATCIAVEHPVWCLCRQSRFSEISQHPQSFFFCSQIRCSYPRCVQSVTQLIPFCLYAAGVKAAPFGGYVTVWLRLWADGMKLRSVLSRHVSVSNAGRKEHIFWKWFTGTNPKTISCVHKFGEISTSRSRTTGCLIKDDWKFWFLTRAVLSWRLIDSFCAESIISLEGIPLLLSDGPGGGVGWHCK